MSLSTRSYSKEARSSSHYSRSSSYHTGGNNSSSYYYRSSTFDDRPLSTRLIERDYSYPSLIWNSDFYDPFYFDRIRWRFDNDFFKSDFGLGRPIPIYYRSWNNSSTRIIPIQYTPSTTNRRHQLYKKTDNDDLSSSFSKYPDESSISNYFIYKFNN
jgi:hypothetical protein